MPELYILGGSPCSGKSTVAERLRDDCGLAYFKVDDGLDGYTARGAAAGNPVCLRVQALSPEENWMRAPDVQNQEELDYYEAIFPYVWADLQQALRQGPTVTEGAAWLPRLVAQRGVLPSRYLCLTPTKAFQVRHYSQRPYVPFVLEGCSDTKQAFANWMERDALFGEEARRQCASLGYRSLVNDGTTAIDALVAQVRRHFAL